VPEGLQVEVLQYPMQIQLDAGIACEWYAQTCCRSGGYSLLLDTVVWARDGQNCAHYGYEGCG
jgi:hypothetical protein